MSKDLELEKALEASLQDLPKLLRKQKEALEAREKELGLAKKALEQEHPTLGTPSDVLRLNVGGTRMDVLRRTLTSIEGSMLASKFSGRWDDNLEKDAEGNFFIDQDYNLFSLMINNLRARQNATPLGPPVASPLEEGSGDEQERNDFIRMVEYYGMTLGVYPVEFKLVRGEPKNVQMIGHPDYSVDAEEWVTVSLLPTGHNRRIRAFEVNLGPFSTAHVGWMDSNNEKSFLESGDSKGVGEAKYSIGFDCSRSGIVVGTQFQAVPGGSIEEGAVLRCEEGGKRWFVNGRLVATTSNKSEGDVVDISSVHPQLSKPVPCISMKGKSRFSCIELYL